MINVLKSRTNWTVIIMVITSLAQALQSVMEPELYALIMGILGALAVYFRTVPKQVAE